MSTITKFQDLIIWQLSRKIENQVFIFTQKDGFKKDYGLTNQINRATVSVMSNIAEGFGRGSNKEFLNFIIIAKGSINEVQSQIFTAYDWLYLNKDEFEMVINLANETAGTITNFMKTLRNEPDRNFRKT